MDKLTSGSQSSIQKGGMVASGWGARDVLTAAAGDSVLYLTSLGRGPNSWLEATRRQGLWELVSLDEIMGLGPHVELVSLCVDILGRLLASPLHGDPVREQ